MSSLTAATSNVTVAGGAPTTASASSLGAATTATLTSTDFLQILVAEFQDQDPTSPTDPTQFASQLVQFANLGQLQNIDSAVTPSNSSNLMQAASAYIGREVVTPGNLIGVTQGKATSIRYTPAATGSYTAQVFNAAGQQVDTVSLGTQTGNTSDAFTWSPPSGNPDGAYTVTIANSQGTAVSGLLEQGVVQSVALTSSGIALNLGNLVLQESSIDAVAQPSS